MMEAGQKIFTVFGGHPLCIISLSLVRYFEIAVHMKWYLRGRDFTRRANKQMMPKKPTERHIASYGQAAVSRLAGSRNLGYIRRSPPPAFPNFRAWFRPRRDVTALVFMIFGDRNGQSKCREIASKLAKLSVHRTN